MCSIAEVRLMVKCDQAPAGARVIRNGSNVMVYCHHVGGRVGKERDVVIMYLCKWSPAVGCEVLGCGGVCKKTKGRALQSWEEIILGASATISGGEAQHGGERRRVG